METTGVGVDAASVLMLLPRRHAEGVNVASTAGSFGARGRLFECKTCGRRFPTFQALGGHRASHRPRPKPYPYPYGADDPAGLRQNEPCAPAAGPRLHGCPICGLQFAVGQALGGHMRRHRTGTETAAADASCARSGDANATSVEEAGVGGAGCASGIYLDLNLAPSENCVKCRNNTVHGVRKSLISDCPPL